MKIATFNVNGINGRLPRLLEWLARDAARRRLPAGAEDRRRRRSRRRRSATAGYGAVWHGQRSLQRRRDPRARQRAGRAPARPARRSPTTRHSRYIEAAVDGVVVASIYLPNGNPQPGPKFDYKLAWFERLIAHADELLATAASPVVLAGDYNVVPTDARHLHDPTSWRRRRAAAAREPRRPTARLLAQGWTDAIAHAASRTSGSTRSGTTVSHTPASRECGSTSRW